ncbi:MAG: hypothetical protein ATN35_06040 [Epulopiscium sp. Nele67-Bin004]|nr:MAG: hypothetical protein ATN35_06040 [Epulopiscium sp. Nele67-Bin004]
MGSITRISQGTDILNQYEYDAWGEVVSQTETVPNRFKFNGQQLDPITQQYYLRARYYNPVIARFTQEDTYRGDGLNLYAYCANNPVMYVDPTGYLCKVGAQTIRDKIANNTATTIEKQQLATYDNLQNVITNKMTSEGITRTEAINLLQNAADNKSYNYNTPRNPAKKAAAKGYPGVGSTSNNGLDYSNSSYLYQDGLNVCNITLTGNRENDFSIANQKGGYSETPIGYTWHHVDNFNVATGEATLILVETAAHRSIPHAGSCAQYKAILGTAYK